MFSNYSLPDRKTQNIAFRFSLQFFNALKLRHVLPQWSKFNLAEEDQNRTRIDPLFAPNPNQSAYFLKAIPLNGLTLAVFSRKIVKSKSKKN